MVIFDSTKIAFLYLLNLCFHKWLALHSGVMSIQSVSYYSFPLVQSRQSDQTMNRGISILNDILVHSSTVQKDKDKNHKMITTFPSL